MSKITLTIEGDDWADVGLGIADLWSSLNARASQSAQNAPHAAPTPPVVNYPAGGPDALVDGPAGECPKHHRPLKSGQYGWFCSAKDDTQPKGYCSLKPGDIYNGVRVVAAA